MYPVSHIPSKHRNFTRKMEIYMNCLAPKHQGWLRMDQLIVGLVHPKRLIGRKFGASNSLENFRSAWCITDQNPKHQSS